MQELHRIAKDAKKPKFGSGQNEPSSQTGISMPDASEKGLSSGASDADKSAMKKDRPVIVDEVLQDDSLQGPR